MNPRGLTIARTAWTVVSAIFLSVMFMSLFFVSSGMDLVGGMSSGCPFMSHEEVICPMSTLEHLAAWKSAFVAITPSLVVLLSALAAVVIVLTVAPNRLLRQRHRTRTIFRCLRERVYTFSSRSFQELFSNGILHPKLF